jgi:hypothetical protein
MQITYDVEGVLDWRCVVHGSEEVFLDRKNDGLLQKLVAHQELLARTGNVSVAVLDTHAGEPCLLHLERNESGQIKSSLGFLGWVDTGVCGSSPDIKALITDLVHHY